MFRLFRSPLIPAALAVVMAAAAPAAARTDAGQAPDSKSAKLAKELVDMLTTQSRDSMAARHPIERDRFIAALMYPGQLMVVTGKYSVPVLLDEKISFGKYRDVYIELNGAAVPSSKMFIEDQFADGLVSNRKQSPFDSVVDGGKTILFDGDHKKKKMSKEDYAQAFEEADAMYTKLLELLLAQAKAAKGL